MTTISLADLEAHLSEYADRAEKHERITVTRNGRPSFVVLVADDLESLTETETETVGPGRGARPLTADLPAADAELLTETATLTGYNKATTLVRAIRVLADLERTVRSGGEVIVKDADGTRSRLMLR